MTTVPPTNPALPQLLAAAAAGAPTAPPTVTVATPPPAVAALAIGTTLEGTVTPTPDPRVTVLATAAGAVTLRTPAPLALPEGATLTVEVVRATPAQVTLRLVALDGQPLGAAATTLPRAPVVEAPPPQPAQTNVPPPPTPGTPAPLAVGAAWWPGGAVAVTALPTISATVLAAPPLPPGAIPTGLLTTAAAEAVPTTVAGAPKPEAAGTPPQAPAAKPLAVPVGPQPAATVPTAAGPAVPAPAPVLVGGADLGLRIVAVALPAQPAGAQAIPPGATPTVPIAVVETAPAAPAPTTTAPTAIVPPGPAPPPVAGAGPAGAEPAAAPPGPTLARPTDAVPPQPPAAVQAPPPAAVVTATVIRIADGVPVLRIAEAEVQLNIRANLPPGTTLTVELVAQQVPPTPTPAAAPASAFVPLSLAQPGWPTLSEAVQLLQRSDPAAAQQLAAAIPDGGPRTAVALMAFVQAMRTGDGRAWPGDEALRALERTGPRGAHLAGQLAAEVADLGRQVRDAGAEWRAIPMPWQAEGKVERIRLLMRETDPDEAAEKRKRGSGTRFLIDLDLSRLGPLQLDGLFRKDTRQFDLMIRTKAALPEAMQRDLMGIFAAGNAAMNLAGGLTFQVVKKFADPSGLRAAQDRSGLWV